MSFKKALTISLICILFTSAAIAKSVGNPRYASLVIDAKNGMILAETNAGEYRYPASLTKMMTLYIAFSALEQGRLSENQLLKVSSHAAGQARTKIGFRNGEKISVQDALRSIAVLSANDSAVVVAEALGGSEQKFAQLMTSTARKLGMQHTTFMNASGLHHPKQRTTAYDMARLAIALRRDFPKYYPLFDREQFSYRGNTYYSHNRVSRKYQGADGIKTGFIGASGYNLVTSAVRNERYVVGVVFGGQTFKRRDDHMINLLDHAFYTLAKGSQLNNAYAIRMPDRITPSQALAMGSVVPSTITAKEVAKEIEITASYEPPAPQQTTDGINTNSYSNSNVNLNAQDVRTAPEPQPQTQGALPANELIIPEGVREKEISTTSAETKAPAVAQEDTAAETKEVLEAMAKNPVPEADVTQNFTKTSLDQEEKIGVADMPPVPQITKAPAAAQKAVAKKVIAKKKVVQARAKKVTPKLKPQVAKTKLSVKTKAKPAKKIAVNATKKMPTEIAPVPTLKP